MTNTTEEYKKVTQRFTGSISLNDPLSVAYTLPYASDSQLTFWYKCAKAQKFDTVVQLICDEMANRSVEEYKFQYGD